ncbi:MAG: 30S ribosomal protein S16 [bacterium]
MLMIRLQRVGKKHDPSFRVLLTDSKNSTKSGKFIEVLGHYDARGGKTQLNKDRITHWLSVGAKTSVTLHNLLVRNKVVKEKTLNALPKKKKTEAEKKAAAEAKVATPVA